MLYRTLKAFISMAKKNNRAEALNGMKVKLDAFLSAGKLTKAEYNELKALLEE